MCLNWLTYLIEVDHLSVDWSIVIQHNVWSNHTITHATVLFFFYFLRLNNISFCLYIVSQISTHLPLDLWFLPLLLLAENNSAVNMGAQLLHDFLLSLLLDKYPEMELQAVLVFLICGVSTPDLHNSCSISHLLEILLFEISSSLLICSFILFLM